MTGQVELLEAPSLWQQPEGEQLEIAQGRFSAERMTNLKRI